MATNKKPAGDKIPEIKAGTYEVRPIGKLRPWDRNARKHPKSQVEELAGLLKRYGWTKPLIIDERDRVLAGNGTLEAARLLKLVEVPVIVKAGLSEDEARAYVIADNKVGEKSSWDLTLLAVELGDLRVAGFDLELTGFDMAEVKDLLEPVAGKGQADPDQAPEPQKEPVSRTGDLYVLGEHFLLVGDSFDPEHVDRLLSGLEHGRADLVLTDPPYAIYGSSTGIAADIADDKMVRPFFEKLGQAIAGRLKEFGHAYVHCDWRSYATVWHGMKSAQMAPKNCIVWDKGSAGLGNSYANTHEFVAFFAKLPPQKAMTSGNKRGQRPVHQPNVFRCNRVSGAERQHNAAKPVELLEWLMENSSDPGDTVLDLFSGSGSTMMAAERKGRRSRCMEMEPKWADVAVRRWQAYTGKAAVLADHGTTFEALELERRGAR